VQATSDTHDTLLKAPSLSPGGLAIAWIDHVPLLQRSASILCLPACVSYPTAKQMREEGHDTPSSGASSKIEGFGGV
jgi:hypothetical protein